MAENASDRGWVFVDWVPDCSRSDAIAARLGMGRIRHYRAGHGIFSTAVKYPYQMARTLFDLFRQRPEAVMCMNPPPLAALPVWLYARITGARWVIDAHTGAFIGPPWERLAFLSRFFSRRAECTFVTNEHLRALVVAAGGRSALLPDVPTELEPPYRAALPDGFNAVFVASWAPDEPVEIVRDAALDLRGMTFHFTGRPEGRGRERLRERPANVVLSGFLSRAEYLALLAAADVVIALTTRDHTMQRSAYEAIYLGTPVIVSDWPVLRDNFAGGGIATPNTREGLVAALRRAQAEIEDLRAGALELRAAKLRRWARNERVLRGLLDGDGSYQQMPS